MSIGASENHGVGLEQFGTLRGVPHQHTRGSENRAFFWNGSGVGQNAGGAPFFQKEFAKRERLRLFDIGVERYIELFQHFFELRMYAEEDLFAFGEMVERVSDGNQGFPVSYVFAAVQCDEYTRAFGFDRLRKVFRHDFRYGVAGDGNLARMAAFPQQVFPASLRVGQEPVGKGVHNPPVRFFRNVVVVAAVSRFHVEDRYVPAFACVGSKRRIRVSEDEGGVRTFLFENLVDFYQQVPYVLQSDGPCFRIELIVGKPEVQVLEKVVVEFVREVLSGMDEDVARNAIELLNNFGQSNKLRSSSDYGDDFPHSDMLCPKYCAILSKTPLLPIEIVVKPHDVILFQVVAYLAFYEVRGNFSRVFQPVGGSCRNERGFALLQDSQLFANCYLCGS